MKNALKQLDQFKPKNEKQKRTIEYARTAIKGTLSAMEKAEDKTIYQDRIEKILEQVKLKLKLL